MPPPATGAITSTAVPATIASTAASAMTPSSAAPATIPTSSRTTGRAFSLSIPTTKSGNSATRATRTTAALTSSSAKSSTSTSATPRWTAGCISRTSLWHRSAAQKPARPTGSTTSSPATKSPTLSTAASASTRSSAATATTASSAVWWTPPTPTPVPESSPMTREQRRSLTRSTDKTAATFMSKLARRTSSPIPARVHSIATRSSAM